MSEVEKFLLCPKCCGTLRRMTGNQYACMKCQVVWEITNVIHQAWKAANGQSEPTPAAARAVVQFMVAAEFLEEIRADVGAVDRGIVRVTREYRGHSQLPLITVILRATALVKGCIVSLAENVGQGWAATHESKELEAKSVRQMTELEGALRTLGLITRPGVFEPVERGRN
jgi:hypothetical protein